MKSSAVDRPWRMTRAVKKSVVFPPPSDAGRSTGTWTITMPDSVPYRGTLITEAVGVPNVTPGSHSDFSMPMIADPCVWTTQLANLGL